MVPSFGWKHYVPILKAKQGELKAIRYLEENARRLVTPLLEPTPPSEKSTPEERLLTTVKAIQTSWPDGLFFADLLWIKSAKGARAAKHPVEYFFGQARDHYLHAVPVTSIDRDPEFQNATREIVRSDGLGLCIRLSQDHLALPDLATPLKRLVAFMGLSPSQADILLDFGATGTIAAGLLTRAMRGSVDSLPQLDEWRTLTVAASSFPATLESLPKGEWSRLDRKEWTAWQTLVTGASKPARLPTYGDFTAADPGLPFSGHANFSCGLRYATGSDFFVWKGFSLRDHPRGYMQIFDICADLVHRPEYAGDSFSRGDREIQARATSRGSPGTLSQWRGWGVSHHIELVASQLSSLPAT